MTMTTPDTFTLLDPSAATAQLLTLEGYVAFTGKTERTVRRWLAADELPGARKSPDGAWMIPADAVRSPGAGAALSLVDGGGQVTTPETPATLPELLAEQPAFLELDTAARLLGVTEYTIRRNQDTFGAVRLGAHGALVVPQSTVRRVAGL